MFWVIRWTDAQSNDDKAIVLEAETRASAECMALRRGIPTVFIGEASEGDIQLARLNKLLWKYTPAPRYSCFGQSIGTRHVACIMLCGVWTIFVLLRVGQMPLWF
jgi:hypothetical protein